MKSNMVNMVLSLTVIAVLMGGVLGFVHELTEEPIAQSQAAAKQAAMQMVFPLGIDSIGEPEEIYVDGDSRAVAVYPVKKDGSLAGAAVETWTMEGFSGEIIVMVGFSYDGKITGYQVLSHSETPGLGSKANDWFRPDDADATTGASVKPGGRNIIGSRSALALVKDGGDIDGITAATITSRAFINAVNRARQAFDIWKSQEQ